VALAVVAVLAAACNPAVSGSSGTTRVASTASPTVSASPTRMFDPTPTTPVPTIAIVPVDDAWTGAIDRAVAGHADDVSVAVGVGHQVLYAHLGDRPRVPASNQKLLTSIVALDLFGAAHTFDTVVGTEDWARGLGIVRGELWLVGSGDPELGDAALRLLADRIVDAGVVEVDGNLMADTGPFTNEWWAPGWVPGLSRDYVNVATALAFEGNEGTRLPQLHAADALDVALEAEGVPVKGGDGTGPAPTTFREIARIRSRPLAELLVSMNQGSLNLYAETLLKAIGEVAAPDGASTRSGAQAVEAWVAARGITAEVKDGSGLSHLDLISAQDLVSLLLLARDAPWSGAFVGSLAAPGQGTLEGRLLGVPLLAKTGTLFETDVSTLSGYVTDAGGEQVAFAVMSEGLDKATAVRIEDAIVRTLAAARIA
jgi:D-alanyl-D-alanine carboxypeptidase/D-alanyl-D-alanine-endopeptidase (penicillin-binding protein 4)